MKQASLKFKTSIQNVNIMNNNIEVNRVVLKALLFALVALAILYVLILGNMVFNIVGRKTLEKEMLTLSNDISKLELTYLSVSSSVDMAMSSTMGFKETKATFATRKSLGFNSGNTNLGNIKLAKNEI
ncbi:MAG: hypothetical protein WC847_00885 [Candidatus Paceibacterota bacterium]|jgi:hypothetical protein